MKNLFSPLTLITILLLSLSQFLIAQTKREVQFSLDTLIKSHQALISDYNELQDSLKHYEAFYEHVKTNLFLKQLQNSLLNEAEASFDTSLQKRLENKRLLTDSLALLNDSLTTSIRNLSDLEDQISNYSEVLMAAFNASSFPQTESELVGTWDLFLTPTQINGTPTEAGLISFHPFHIPDSIKQHRITKIEFAPDELATLVFHDGVNQKCFYSIHQFSSNSSFTIEFSKKDEFKLIMHISYIPQGLQASYEIPVQTNNTMYFQGLMKK